MPKLSPNPHRPKICTCKFFGPTPPEPHPDFARPAWLGLVAIGVSSRAVPATFLHKDIESIVLYSFFCYLGLTIHLTKRNLVWGYTNTRARILLLFHILVNCHGLNAGQQLSQIYPSAALTAVRGVGGCLIPATH